jgi:UDPglucose 6-dehydrogenase
MGLGYVGLTKAIHFAKNGHSVWGYDVDPTKAFSSEEVGNKLWINEPHLQEYYDEIRQTNLFQEDLETSVLLTNIAFVCVGTPKNDDGSVKLDYVYQAMADLGRAIGKTSQPYTIVLKSTVTPGTSHECIRILERHSGRTHGEDIFFTMVPEFLQEGKALAGLAFPDKIVIGYKFKKELEQVMGLYMSCINRDHKERVSIIAPNYVNAEFIKYANNAFLATKISFVNYLANMCENIYGADINIIASAIGEDYRISPNFLQAGLGFGGSCFGKDVMALRMFGDTEDNSLLSEVLAINYSQRDWAFWTTLKAIEDHVEHEWASRVAVLGIAFKPNTDDMRDAPAIDIIDSLISEGFIINMHDPMVKENAAKQATNYKVSFQDNVLNAIRGTDAVIICTDWDEYKTLEPAFFKEHMRTPIVIDGRRIYKPQEMLYNNIHYYGVGYGRFDATN